MFYLHTMVRISNVDESLKFYCDIMGLELARKVESEKGRYTNFFLYAPNDKNGYEDKKSPALELTYNWDPEKYSGGRNFGHLAYRVNNIYDYCIIGCGPLGIAILNKLKKFNVISLEKSDKCFNTIHKGLKEVFPAQFV